MQVSLIGAPTDVGASMIGCRLGPGALRVANIGDRFTSFGFIPLLGHFFHPLMWPNNLYPHCTRRVTVKAVNELVDWLESRPPKETPAP